MKRIFTVLALGIIFSASAQRHADIAITGISFPTNKSTIKSDMPFPLAFNLKNNGPDSVNIADSIFIYLGSNGLIDSTKLRLEIYITVIPPDSTITLLDATGVPFVNPSMHWSGYASDSLKSFCVMARLHSAAIDPVVDPSLANNTNCTDSVHMLEVYNYLGNRSAINIYPNPARSVINLNLNLVQEAHVTIKLFDLLGRNILSREQDKLFAGEHTIPISIDGIQNGMYLYQVSIDGNVQTGRLCVAK